MRTKRVFEPIPPARRCWLNIGILLWGAGLVLLARVVLARPFNLLTYGLGLLWGGLVLAWAVYTYRVRALARMYYWVDRNGLYVRWGWTTFVFPMSEMVEVHRPGLPLHLPKKWWDWPTPYVGEWTMEGKRLFLYSTVPPSRAWFFCGPDACVGLSPREGEALVEALNQRRALGPTRVLSLGRTYASLFQARVLQDTVALAMVATGFLLLLLLWGEVAARSAMPLFRRTAYVATFILGLDWILGGYLYRRERVPALALWGAGDLVIAALLIHLWISS